MKGEPRTLLKNAARDKYLLLLMLPVVLYYIVFHYFPMYGVVIAFKNYSAGRGILGSPWAGLRWFKTFFGSIYAWRTIRNTVLISIYRLIWGFPIPIIFALLLNELRNGFFKRAVQTVSYLPHFISMVVVVGMMVTFLSPTDGIVNVVLKKLGGKSYDFMSDPRWFRALFIGSGIWQNFGWNSIIYLAALSGLDPQLYEAARIDGANRWHQVIYITLPGIMPTVVILLILALGRMLSVGFEKIILMYGPAVYETADVISTYVYRRGLLNAEYSYGAAVGLFNSLINFSLLVSANWLSKRVSQVSLW